VRKLAGIVERMREFAQIQAVASEKLLRKWANEIERAAAQIEESQSKSGHKSGPMGFRDTNFVSRQMPKCVVLTN